MEGAFLDLERLAREIAQLARDGDALAIAFDGRDAIAEVFEPVRERSEIGADIQRRTPAVL